MSIGRHQFSYTVLAVSIPVHETTFPTIDLKAAELRPYAKIKPGVDHRGIVFSFFSGSGFLDLGFEHEHFLPALVNEMYAPFLTAYKHSRQVMGMPTPPLGYLDQSIETLRRDKGRKWLRKRVQEARATGLPVGFIGGPPCPDFSNAGKHKGKEGMHGRLTKVYIDLIRDQQPDFFVFENVKGLMRNHASHLNELETKLGKAGYRFSTRLVNSLEYGVPQDRERVVIIGIHRRMFQRVGQPVPWFYRLDNPGWQVETTYDMEHLRSLPWPTAEPFVEGSKRLCPAGIVAELTVEYWFRRNDVTNHTNAGQVMLPQRGRTKMESIDEGDTTRKSFKRLHRWRYSATAAYGNLEVHLHPSEVRRLTVAETLAIQSMPQEFELPSDMTLTDAFKTVGNGVPYLMARGLARTVANQLDALSPVALAAD